MPIIKRSPETDMPKSTPLAADESGIDLPTPTTATPFAALDRVNITDLTDAIIAIPTNSTEIATKLSDATLDLSVEMSSSNDTQSRAAMSNTTEPTLSVTTNLDMPEPTSLTTETASDINPNTRLDNNLLELGLVSAAQGAFAGVVRTATEAGFTWLKSKGHLKGWREPLAKVSAIAINSAIIATLPLMLSSVENESEKNESLFQKILTPTLYSIGTSLIFEGINYTAQYGYYYFNKQAMSPKSISRKALDSLPLLSNVSLLINEGYYFTEAAVTVSSNTAGASLLYGATQCLASHFINSTKKDTLKDVEKGLEKNINFEMAAVEKVKKNAFEEDNFNLDSQFQSLAVEAFNTKNLSKLDAFPNASEKMKFFENKDDIKTQAFFMKNLILLAMQNPEIGLNTYNHLQSQKRLFPTNKNLEENCSIIPFTLSETANHEIHNKESNTEKNITQLKKLLGSFISGLKLNTKDFKFESKIFTLNKCSFERINIFHGTNKVLSIFTPEIKQALSNNKLLFPTINKLIENLSKNKSDGNNIYLKFLLVLPSKSTVIEIVTFANSSKSSGEITIYNPDDSFKKEFQILSNVAKIYKYDYKLKKDDLKYPNLLARYYFIKNSIKNYLKDCLLPNNASPDFLEGLLATFIYKLKLIDLKFETKKVNSIENDEDYSQTKNYIVPKNTEITEEKIDLKNGYLVSTIERKRNKAMAVCQTTSNNNNILSFFKSIPLSSESAHVINCLLNKRKVEIQTNEISKDLLSLTTEKGIAILEIITSKALSKPSEILIHDPLHLLNDIYEKIRNFANKNGYQYKNNPNKDYSSEWLSKERCQLAAYNFIKKTAHKHLELPEQMSAEFSNQDKNLPDVILAELKQNLNLKNEYDIDSFQQIIRCDGGVFNLPTYIADVSNYLKILSIESTPLLKNASDLHQVIATDMQHNLGLANLQNNLLASSELEIITWNGVRFDNWPELFSTKEISLSQTEIANAYYLVKFSSDFTLIEGKMAVLAKQENNEPPLLSDIRNFLVYTATNNPDKIIKKTLRMNDLRGLFSKFTTKENDTKEIELYSANKKCGFFKATANAVSNPTAVVPVQPNHLTRGCN